MKIYQSPFIRGEIVKGLVSTNQYVDLGLLNEDPAFCGIMGIEDNTAIAAFCTTSNEDHASELNGVTVRGCDGFETKLTNCIVFDDEKTSAECSGLVYVCNTESSSVDEQAIASVGDSECSTCPDLDSGLLNPA